MVDGGAGNAEAGPRLRLLVPAVGRTLMPPSRFLC